MDYQIDKIASEIMLDPHDLQEVYELFFEECKEALAQCRQVLQECDYNALRQIFHGLKGASANLRIELINNLTKKLEEAARLNDAQSIYTLLPQLKESIQQTEKQVKSYFNNAK